MITKLLKSKHWLLLVSLFTLLVILSLLSEGFYGGADNVTHYYISRYSFQYHHLFLNPWGRPVFTIMSSPFSQFGFQGLKIFNILLGCLTALLAFLTARKLGIARPWLVIIFVIFTPMYFLMTMTGLTEIQFGFILILAVYLFFDEKYIAAAIIISFLPLSRSEGFAFFPIFFVALLMKQKYAAIPFLLSGIILFSLLGYFFVWHDIFWIFTRFPYPLHHPLYKVHGPLLFFVDHSLEMFGIPLLVLFLSGIGIYAYLFFKVPKQQRVQVFLEIWMLAIPVLLFFAVHSVLYWKALFGSMGLIRVVTGVLPLAAIVSLKAWDFLENRFFPRKILKTILVSLLIFIVILSNFIINQYPVKGTPGEQSLRIAINWFRTTPYIDQKIYYTDYNVPFMLDLDPYSGKRCEQLYNTKWILGQPTNTIVIWDQYYGTHECKVPLAYLEDSGAYRLMNRFRPLPGNYWVNPAYEICIFRKTPQGIIMNNKPIRDSLKTMDNESRYRFIWGSTFELNPQNRNDDHISGEFARSGKSSYKVKDWEQFPLAQEFDPSKVLPPHDYQTFRVSCFVYPLVPFRDNDTRLVVTLKDDNKYYQCVPLDSVARKMDQWNKVSFKATFPVFKRSNRLVVYFWHLGKKVFYIDDLKIEAVNP